MSKPSLTEKASCFKLIFTVAIKAELPLDWLTKLNIPVFTLKALQSGILKTVNFSTTSGVLFIITGVGTQNSTTATNWIKNNLTPLFVVNLGTCATQNKLSQLLTWITPTTAICPNQPSITIDTRLPFPFTQTRQIVPELQSTNEPITTPQQTNFFDMECHAQATGFADSNISFHVLKIISDYANTDTNQNYHENLSQIQQKIKIAMSWLEGSNTPPEISIIIPVYNRSQQIQTCLDSILAQTYPTKEIIVVDDGSTDGTTDLLQKLYQDQITLITLPQNQGVSVARNIGIAQASSTWIALCDSDDCWTTDKLAKQTEFMRKYPFFEILQSQEIWIRNGKRVNACKHHQKPAGFIFEPSLNLCLISPSSVVFTKELFCNYDKFDEKLPVCEDYDLWLRITRDKAIGLEETASLIKYGGAADQLSQKYEAMDTFRIIALEKSLQEETDLAYQKAIATVLKEKLTILLNGAKKRQLTTKITLYEQKLTQLSQLISP